MSSNTNPMELSLPPPDPAPVVAPAAAAESPAKAKKAAGPKKPSRKPPVSDVTAMAVELAARPVAPAPEEKKAAHPGQNAAASDVPVPAEEKSGAVVTLGPIAEAFKADKDKNVIPPSADINTLLPEVTVGVVAEVFLPSIAQCVALFRGLSERAKQLSAQAEKAKKNIEEAPAKAEEAKKKVEELTPKVAKAQADHAEGLARHKEAIRTAMCAYQATHPAASPDDLEAAAAPATKARQEWAVESTTALKSLKNELTQAQKAVTRFEKAQSEETEKKAKELAGKAADARAEAAQWKAVHDWIGQTFGRNLSKVQFPSAVMVQLARVMQQLIAREALTTTVVVPDVVPDEQSGTDEEDNGGAAARRGRRSAATASVAAAAAAVPEPSEHSDPYAESALMWDIVSRELTTANLKKDDEKLADMVFNRKAGADQVRRRLQRAMADPTGPEAVHFAAMREQHLAREQAEAKRLEIEAARAAAAAQAPAAAAADTEEAPAEKADSPVKTRARRGNAAGKKAPGKKAPGKKRKASGKDEKKSLMPKLGAQPEHRRAGKHPRKDDDDDVTGSSAATPIDTTED